MLHLAMQKHPTNPQRNDIATSKFLCVLTDINNKLHFFSSPFRPHIPTCRPEPEVGLERKMPSPWQQLVNHKQVGTVACGWMGVDMVTVVKRGGEHMRLQEDFTFNIPKHEHMSELQLASFKNTEQTKES